MRRALLLVAALAAAGLGVPARAGAATADLPPGPAALVPLQAEMMLLVELGAWSPPIPPKVQAVHDEWVSFTAGMDRDDLLAWVADADTDGRAALDRVLSEVGEPSTQVRAALGRLGSADLDALARGDHIALPPMTYEKAWFDLDERDGLAPGAPAPAPAPSTVVTEPAPATSPATAPTDGGAGSGAASGPATNPATAATTAPAGTVATGPVPVTGTAAIARGAGAPAASTATTATPGGVPPTTAGPGAASTVATGRTSPTPTVGASTTAAATTAGASTTAATVTTTTGRSTAPLVLAAVAGLLAALAAVMLGRRVRRRPQEAGLSEAVAQDLLDAGQRLTGSLDTAEVERRAVAEAVALTDAAHGAFVRGRAQGRQVAHTTTAGFPADADLERGVVARALDAGQSARTAGSDRAVSGDRLALLAAPAVHAGVVVGALVVARPAGRPFGAADADALNRLAPLVAGALDAAARHADTAALALVDPLTSVGNRRRLERDLPTALGRHGPVALVMVDVDHFKRFNDTFGHQAGDDALRLVAAALSANVRDVDVVYRYGGEEFCVLLADATPAEAAEAGERLRLAVAAASVLSWSTDPRRALTVSVGVALSAPGEPGDALLSRADQALYAAKRTGRDRVVIADR